MGVWFFEVDPAQAVARLMPQQSREALGRNFVAALAKDCKACETPASRAALDRLTQRLTAAASSSPMPVRVMLLDWRLVNAFAMPGGQIILTRGLVQTAGSPDEVAGVLAHELGHALELHPETGLVRAMGLAAAAQLIFAGSAGTVSNVGLVLTQLRYTRIAEREADAHALRMLKGAGISSQGLRRLLRAPRGQAAGHEAGKSIADLRADPHRIRKPPSASPWCAPSRPTRRHRHSPPRTGRRCAKPAGRQRPGRPRPTPPTARSPTRRGRSRRIPTM